MRVKVRAVIMQDGKLVVSRERRRGVEHLLLPGGRVQAGEAITEALVREVAEETGLEVVPERVLYVAEVVGSYGVHDLNLVWLAEPHAQLADPRALVALDSPEAAAMMPPNTGSLAVPGVESCVRLGTGLETATLPGARASNSASLARPRVCSVARP